MPDLRDRGSCPGGCRRGAMRYFLGLGSNLGDKRRNLERARRRLVKAGVTVLNTSSVYRTAPVDVTDQPWFANQVLEVRTDRTPQELLELAKAVEAGLGRWPAGEKGPRTIDIDILLAGDTVIDTPSLTIPHPRLAARNFVLVPLLEIAPGAMHPGLRKTVRELAQECPDRSAVLIDRTRSVARR
ncbi:MAG TPA: 2-amino-4-hydroxy-6-hydroxymethyldihydropteridine diphosphokinase [Burkholderiales bacterium]|nr:2-amino-4-hydroxy-6-hydroxymethyldihydropteridine diphosphokinase [Burkholderiales bacterium]